MAPCLAMNGHPLARMNTILRHCESPVKIYLDRFQHGFIVLNVEIMKNSETMKNNNKKNNETSTIQKIPKQSIQLKSKSTKQTDPAKQTNPTRHARLTR